MKKFIFLTILLISLVLTGCVLKNDGVNEDEGRPVASDEQEEEVVDTEEDTEEDPIASWETYTDSNANFSLKYSSDIKLNPGEPPLELSLYITVEEVNSLPDEYPLNYGRLSALEDISALGRGEYGIDCDFAFDESKEVIKIGDKYAKSFVVFGRFEVCSVTFERKAIFYNDGYRVILTLSGAKNEIKEGMSQYFKYDESNCGKFEIWDFDKQDDFYNDLVNKDASSAAQNWYEFFDSIIETIEIK